MQVQMQLLMDTAAQASTRQRLWLWLLTSGWQLCKPLILKVKGPVS
jgi:hypothetical protein